MPSKPKASDMRLSTIDTSGQRTARSALDESVHGDLFSPQADSLTVVGRDGQRVRRHPSAVGTTRPSLGADLNEARGQGSIRGREVVDEDPAEDSPEVVEAPLPPPPSDGPLPETQGLIDDASNPDTSEPPAVVEPGAKPDAPVEAGKAYYETLTRPKLRDLLKERGVPTSAKDNKGDLVTLAVGSEKG